MEIVNYQIAKKLHNLGFVDIISCIGGKNYYNYKGEFEGDATDEIKELVLAKKEKREFNKEYKSIPAFRQSYIQKWLREVHNIQMFISPLGNNPVEYVVIIPYCYSKKEIPNSGLFDSYEKALEKGLQLALQMI